MSQQTYNRIKFAADLALWTLAALLAFPLRVISEVDEGLPTMVGYGMIALAAGIPTSIGFRLYRQTWRQITMEDLLALLRAVGAGTVFLFTLGLLWHQVAGFPRTVPLIHGALAVMFMGGARLAARLSYERRGALVVRGDGGEQRVLIVGAGDAGARIAREMRRHPAAGLSPVGFLDDDPSKRQVTISGLSVLGPIDDLAGVLHAHRVDQVLISMPSASGRRTRRVVELARQAGVDCRILPGLTEILLAGDVRLAEVRDVQVEDFLRRTPFELDLGESGNYIAGRTVLVTGAGGSIGAELVRQVARLDPKRLVLLGQGENSLHTIQQELRRSVPDLDAAVVVGNVQDGLKMHEVMGAFGPEVVLHAAAHKQVPLLEYNPDEAVLNNVGGTRTVAEAALDAGVERFVNISTDKAVEPISMLGVTKAIAERVVLATSARAGDGQVFVSVRFGNVLGSRGSVVPIFQEQIRRGGPVTLTHPAMTRYFMTIPEASRLVIQAGSFSDNGAVYVLDMGVPVRIEALARDMIRLSGRNRDEIGIVYTGLRPGEKLTEELFTEHERTTATRYDQIMVARSDAASDSDLMGCVDDLIGSARRRDWAMMDLHLTSLVPGFHMSEFGHLQVASL